jgi:hypothetical protein
MTRIQEANRIWCGKTAKPKPIQTAKTKGRLKPNILKMIKKTETAAARHPLVCLERIMLPKQQKRSSKNAIWFSDDLVGLMTAIWQLGRRRWFLGREKHAS